jgi:hypothetical protein
VRRFELGQISSTVPDSTSLRSASSLFAAAMPCRCATAPAPEHRQHARRRRDVVSPVCTVVPSAGGARAREQIA